MKKNLAMSIALLLLAVFTCCGVTFAYFNANQSGSNNSIDVGNFTFDIASSEIIKKSQIRFKAPTIINIPKIIDGADQESHDIFLTNGDDEYFDDYVIPIKINGITNTSITDMGITVKLTAQAPQDEGVIINYAANGAFQYIVFDKATSIALEASTDKNKYEKAIRKESEAYAAELPADTGNTDIDITSIFALTKHRLELARKNIITRMSTDNSNKLAAADISSLPVTYSSMDLIAVMWLDWRGFKEALNSGTRPPGKLNVSVSVTATQFGQTPQI